MIEAKVILRPQDIVITQKQEKYQLISFDVGRAEWTVKYFKNKDNSSFVETTISSKDIRNIGIEIS